MKVLTRGGAQYKPKGFVQRAIQHLEILYELQGDNSSYRVNDKLWSEKLAEKKQPFSKSVILFLVAGGFVNYRSKFFFKQEMSVYYNSWRIARHKKFNLDFLKKQIVDYEERIKEREAE